MSSKKNCCSLSIPASSQKTVPTVDVVADTVPKTSKMPPAAVSPARPSSALFSAVAWPHSVTRRCPSTGYHLIRALSARQPDPIKDSLSSVQPRSAHGTDVRTLRSCRVCRSSYKELGFIRIILLDYKLQYHQFGFGGKSSKRAMVQICNSSSLVL